MTNRPSDYTLRAEHVIYGPVEIKKSDWDKLEKFVECRLVNGNGPRSSPNRLHLGRVALKLK